MKGRKTMIKTKRPMLVETVGALYYNFNVPTDIGEYNPNTYEVYLHNIDK